MAIGLTFAGSRRKKTGVLLKTQSMLPSRVLSFIAKPRGSRAVSAEPDSPPTVCGDSQKYADHTCVQLTENRTVTGHSRPSLMKASAMQMSSSDFVHLKTPCAPAPFAWTTRSGMRSLSKCESRSTRWKSWVQCQMLHIFRCAPLWQIRLPGAEVVHPVRCAVPRRRGAWVRHWKSCLHEACQSKIRS